MSTDNNDNMCANCGKGEEGSVSLKACGACTSIRYCSNDCHCQKAHRSQHKKECRKRAAELHEEALFKQPPPRGDCPICFLRVPSLYTGQRYMTCCGKIICSGCIHAGGMAGDDQLCPFCRAPTPLDEEIIERTRKRMEFNDATAIYNLGSHYAEGRYGLPQDMDNVLELWHRAGELGNAEAYYNIGTAYWYGRGVVRDKKKVVHYYELAAMGGDEMARHNLGNAEVRAGNTERALKHYMIAVGSGHDASLKTIQKLYSSGCATKADYMKALKAYQSYLEEIKSDDRDKAAAFNDEYKYY